MDGQLLELLLVVHMTMKPVQVVQIKRKNQLLDPWTWFPTILQRIEALCTHILRGWCWTSCMSLMCLNMNITTIAMRGSMHWMAKSMISMICSTHSRPEMTLKMTECGGCLGSCIASLCFWFFSLSSVSFSYCFSFQSADCISFMHLFSVFSFCWLYFLPVLIKWYAMLVIFMHLFCLMNPKGEKNWKMDNWSH